MSTEVTRTYLELNSIKRVVLDHGMPSDIIAFEAMAAKCFLLAAASYFEKATCAVIRNHTERITGSLAIVSFLDKQALERKYHTLFDWKQSNINKFIRLFGNEFYNFVAPVLDRDKEKNAAIEFMTLGQMRNKLVHENFSEYLLEHTLDDIKL